MHRWSNIAEGDLPAPADFSDLHPFLKGVFSQWHATPFELDGRSFVTAEQWMMFGKASLFGDVETATRIAETPDPSVQKRLGQQVAGFVQSTWDEAKVGIVYTGNRAKFEQNAGARRQLFGTGTAMLVEANPRDWIWGIGLSADDPDVHRPERWRGSNLLGRILTRVREDLNP